MGFANGTMRVIALKLSIFVNKGILLFLSVVTVENDEL
jgi:hypothetical protein